MHILRTVWLYVGTIRHLKPSQLYYKVIRKLIRRMIQLPKPVSKDIPLINPGKYVISELDFSASYLSRFNVEELMNDTFTFLNLKEKVAVDSNWNNTSFSRHWRFNLHYFEYIFPLADMYRKTGVIKYYAKFKSLVLSWLRLNIKPYEDSWDPYTVSMRLVNWIISFELFYDKIIIDKDFKSIFIKSIYAHYMYLKNTTEKDILGNHYMENLKALILGSIFFAKNDKIEQYFREWEAQIYEQILNDGVHFELSPMYHNIVLEALIKVNYWYPNTKTKRNIEKMLSVSYSLEKNMGKMPFFNDCSEYIAKNIEDLMLVSEKYFFIKPKYKLSFPNSGYHILEFGNKKCIIDAGQIGPRYQPGHGHCDALSYELSIDGQPLIVNSGTYEYKRGYWRDFFRSTRAHNTVMIGNIEQSQCWESFRVADRIKQVSGEVFETKGMPIFVGSGISLRYDIHTRKMFWVDDNLLLVLDSVTQATQGDSSPVLRKHNTGELSPCVAKSYIHIHPDYIIRKDEHWTIIKDQEIVATIISISSDSQHLYCGEEENGWYSPQFGLKLKNYVLELQCNRVKDYFGYILVFDDKPVTTNFSKKQIWITHDDCAKVINIE